MISSKVGDIEIIAYTDSDAFSIYVFGEDVRIGNYFDLLDLESAIELTKRKLEKHVKDKCR